MTNYYHCFLGNGLDAVLIGRTGAMTDEKIVVDRGAWYKADRYYPEDRLVQVAGRWPEGQPLEHAEGSGWFEVAPLGRVWYELRRAGAALPLTASEQTFDPYTGELTSRVQFGDVRGTVNTFLHPRESLLVIHLALEAEAEIRAGAGPGNWVDDGWDTDPFYSLTPAPAQLAGAYDLGETKGSWALGVEGGEPSEVGSQGRDRYVDVRGKTVTLYFSVVDDRQPEPRPRAAYDKLRAETHAFWQLFNDGHGVRLPDPDFQTFYDASQYHFKAMQNRISGGLPVNNLRRTWSSHVFWDAYFIQRALLEAGHTREALEGARFLQRTLAHAERHAREEFDAPGLKWDWEITHDGRKAYGVHLHQKDQVHNNASYANMIWNYYEATRDLDFLREFYPILEGLAEFFLANVVERTAAGVQTRAVVGVHESPLRVHNDGITVAGTLVILRRCAEAAGLLGIDSPIAAECAATAPALTEVFDRLYNGRYFQGAEDRDILNMSSLAVMYPMKAIAWDDPRAISTIRAYRQAYGDDHIGHGENKSAFPWSAGVLATILARQGDGDSAWRVIEGTRSALCTFGGMSEVVEQDGSWNMQYFGTAQGAVCTAINQLLLQAVGDEIRLFPALPSAWRSAALTRFVAAGCEIDATYDDGQVTGRIRNLTHSDLERAVIVGGQRQVVRLKAGETVVFA